jgi:uncharacterized membrane protein HdeD (DUF308 family)
VVADEVQVRTGSIKRRDPWGTFFLGIVTLKVYHFVWYYMINREVRDHSGEDVEADPVVSVLAITLGALVVIPALISLYRTADRVRSVQLKVGATKTISPVLALLLGVISFFNLLNWYMPYLQSHINSAWDVEFARAGR